MYLTKKIRIFPSKEQEELLWILSEKCRLIYNFALKERLEYYNTNKFLYVFLKPIWELTDPSTDSKFKTNVGYVSYFDQYKSMKELRNNTYPEYQWVLERVLGMTLKKLDTNFKSFYALAKKWNQNPQFDNISGKPVNKPNPTRYKGKNWFMVLCYNRSGWKVIENDNKMYIRFSHKHPSKKELIFSIPKKLYPKDIIKIKQIEISFDSNRKRDKSKGKYFIFITYEKEVKEYEDNGLYYAIDLGLDKLIAGVNLKDKTLLINNKSKEIDIFFEKKIQEVQSKRDHCKTYYNDKGKILKRSRKWYFYNNTLIRLKQKKATQIKLFQHRISKKIIENTKANTIIVGDLESKKMGKRKKGTGKRSRTKANKTLNRRLMSGSMGRFIQFLTYKAEKIGKRVIEIDESYTTKRCCKCGKLHPMKLSDRIMNCDCGNHMDRDLNSARNIMLKFLGNKSKYDNLSKSSLLEEIPLLTEEFIKGFATYSTDRLVRSDDT
ncbi:MAG: RNA-guided endonuclease InsQ/TnpB family protein [Candidatus Thorarchaeota archaeon]